MAKETKVVISQWLLTLVGIAFGVWGGYRVLQYKVEENTKDINKAQVVLEKFSDVQTTNSIDIQLIKKDVKQILKKMP